ncbi:MAG: peptidyl-prolyl cis-trans isomerase [Candidatus Melainabacteria bacterium]|nr:peptidyl-prolyl cis-trans isomerase [Candidatus Melainabacteria bacterium]
MTGKVSNLEDGKIAGDVARCRALTRVCRPQAAGGKFTLLTLAICAGTLLLAGCNSKQETSGGEKTGEQTSGTGSGTTTEPAKSEDKTGQNSQTNAPDDATGKEPSVTGGNVQLPNAVNLATLPPTMVICTVDGTPVTISQFKREYREAIGSLQAVLGMQPMQVQELVKQATAAGVSLTAEEKKKLLEAARKPQSLEGKSLDKFLKEKKLTEAEFDKQVIDLGLAFKVGAKLIEQQLLTELINRELLLAEAKAQNFYKPAYNNYLKVKDLPKYKKMLEMSDQTPEEIKEDLIQGEMLIMLMQKIARESVASDKELLAFYQKNKEAFKHGEKVRLSHIVLAAPKVDAPPMESIKTQLKKQNPTMSDADLDKEVLVVKQQKMRLAQELLARANKGEDFKSLADGNTEDMQARQAKNGGDLGYIDVLAAQTGPDQKALLDAVKNLKPGQLALTPVETNFGYHVIKLTEKVPAGTFSFDEIKDQLKEKFVAQNMEAAKTRWLVNKRKSAKIVFSDEFRKASSTASVPQANVK